VGYGNRNKKQIRKLKFLTKSEIRSLLTSKLTKQFFIMTETMEQSTETMEAPISTIKLKEEANAITTRRTIYAAGAGLIPFPLVDTAAILGIQVLMVRDIANVYGADFKEQPVRSIITTLVGDLGALGVMSGVKFIPVVGPFIGGFTYSLAGAAATYALGKVFSQHFSQGGTLLDFDPVTSRKYFQEAYEEGKLYVEDLSETNEGVKEKTGLNKFFGMKNNKEGGTILSGNNGDLTDLRKKNEEMKEMILKLQKSINDLAASK